MSVRMMAEVWELDLPLHLKSVLLVLADHAHDDGTRSFPGKKRIAWKVGTTPDTVKRHLRSLRDLGLIVPTAHLQGGSGLATEYTVVPSAGQRITFDEWLELKGYTDAPLSDNAKGGHPQPQRGAPDAVKGGTHAPPTISNHQQPKYPKELFKPMMTAFCDTFGNPIAGMKKAFGATVNVALDANIKPEQIGPAARRYREAWPGISCNPMALLKHWNTFGPDAHLRNMPLEVRELYGQGV